MTRYIGDVHGDMQKYLELIKGSQRSVQVGDFGIGFIPNPIDSYDTSKHRFIRGNHDNPHFCPEQPNWIADGTIEDDTMYVGGARSIDYQYRTAGYDWWPEEELNDKDLDAVFEKYINAEPRVMITHDCPHFVAEAIVDTKIETRTSNCFEDMWKEHKPELWIFGHYHIPVDWTFKETRFVCLDINQAMDIDDE